MSLKHQREQAGSWAYAVLFVATIYDHGGLNVYKIPAERVCKWNEFQIWSASMSLPLPNVTAQSEGGWNNLSLPVCHNACLHSDKKYGI